KAPTQADRGEESRRGHTRADGPREISRAQRDQLAAFGVGGSHPKAAGQPIEVPPRARRRIEQKLRQSQVDSPVWNVAAGSERRGPGRVEPDHGIAKGARWPHLE